MKKVFLSLMILGALGSVAHAQKFQLGIKGGVNFSNFTGGDFSDVDKKGLIGFHVGGLVAFLIGNSVAIQPEVLFSTQGARIKDAGVNNDFKVSYVNIPVMLKYRFPGGFYLEAGPQIGFKTTERVPNYSLRTFAKSTDVSVAGGLGYHSSIGIGVGARYVAGISKVGDFDASDIQPNFRNSTIQVSVFYTLFNNHR